MLEKKPSIILKADDYGGDPGVRAGILELAKSKYITDVAVMVAFIGQEESDALKEAHTDIGILLHVNFTAGRPLAGFKNVPSLVDDDGIFHRPQALISAWKEYAKNISGEDVKREINAQAERFRKLFGYYPHALDSHNIILAVAPIDEIAMRIAEDLKIPMTYPKLYADQLNPEAPFSDILVTHPSLHGRYVKRGIVTADHCFPEYWNRFRTLDGSVRRFLDAIGSLKPGITEFFFHPGHPDLTSADPRYERGRVRDYMILTDPRVAGKLSTLTLTSYRELSEKDNKQRAQNH